MGSSLCCMCYYQTHAVGTTGMHAAARRRFEYADSCAQCGAALSNSSHVASHVIAYPCLGIVPCNCYVGRLSLQTCCRSCNGKHQTGKRGCVHGFFTAERPVHLEGLRAYCCCLVHNTKVATPVFVPVVPASS